jgi:hypothetical protein
MSSFEQGDEDHFDNRSENATPGNVLHARIGHYHDIRIGVAVPANYVPGRHVSIHITPNVVPFVQTFNNRGAVPSSAEIGLDVPVGTPSL